MRLHHRLVAAACSMIMLALVLPSCGSSAAAPEGCAYPASDQAAKRVQPPPTTDVATSGSTTFVLTTAGGEVAVTMDRATAPCTVNSFASLAAQGYFDKTRCHRLADGGIFVLQCGDPTGSGSGGPGYSFVNETGSSKSYTRGVVAMANAGPGTNGSQFFLVWADSLSLDKQPNYTIFGKMDETSVRVVEKIAAEGHDRSNPDGTGVPNNRAEIIRVEQR